MCSIKLIVLFAVVACSLAEPPRRRFNFRSSFARQEAAEADADAGAESSGYKYEAPEGERLRLPAKFRQFARQEESSPGGYSYPKPTDSYGPPEEETTEPSSEYGPPEGTTESNDESTTESNETETEEPQAERIQAFQFRRKNAKLSRAQKSQKLQKAQVVQFQQQQQVQPVYYVQYPTADLVQPQYVYVFK